MKASKVIRRVVLLAVLALVFAACSSSDEAATEISVEADSFKFSPSDVTVKADTDVTITLTNKSDVDDHEWAIVVAGETIDSEDEFAEELVEWEVEAIAPGATATETFNLPAGEYQVICALEGHLDGGMKGTLTVKDS